MLQFISHQTDFKHTHTHTRIGFGRITIYTELHMLVLHTCHIYTILHYTILPLHTAPPSPPTPFPSPHYPLPPPPLYYHIIVLITKVTYGPEGHKERAL